MREFTASAGRSTGRTAASTDRAGDRRRRLIPFYAPERRSGFDRRRSYAVTGHLRDRPHVLLVLLIAVNVLSLLDFLLTAQELASGLATEGNPVLAPLFASGPLVAWLVKTVLLLLVSLAIWQGRRMRAVLSVAVLAFAVFAAVIGYHLVGVTTALAL